RRVNLFWLPGAALSTGVAVRLRPDQEGWSPAITDRCAAATTQHAKGQGTAGRFQSRLPGYSNCSIVFILALPPARVARPAAMVRRTREPGSESCDRAASIGNPRRYPAQIEL